ncbi:optineurin-like [Branchiostoma lanceolatum]|uniref:optineurin-like n=1 Tax=Branchiostoma lanceolatum TaxID=7740 RepID=UPI0034556878
MSGTPSPKGSLASSHGQRSAGSGQSSSSDFEILSRPPSYQNGSPTPNGDIPSEFSMNAGEMQSYMTELLKDNNSLRDTIRQNNEDMRQKIKDLEVWKEKQKQNQTLIVEKFTEAREKVLSLRKENSRLKADVSMLQKTGAGEGKVTQGQGDASLSEVVSKLKEENNQLATEKEKLNKTIQMLTGEIGKMQIKLEEKQSEQEVVMVQSPPSQGSDTSTGSMLAQQVEEYRLKCEQMSSEVCHFQSLSTKLQEDTKEITAMRDQLAQENQVLKSKLEAELEQMKSETKTLKQANERLQLEKADLVAMNNEMQASLQLYKAGTPPSSHTTPTGSFVKVEAEVKQPQQVQALVAEAAEDDRTVSIEERLSVHPEEQRVRYEDTIAQFTAATRQISEAEHHKKKTETTVHDLLIQLQEERTRGLDISGQLETARKEREELEARVQDLAEQLRQHSANKDSTVEQMKQQHRTEVENLMQQLDSMKAALEAARTPGQQIQVGEDIQVLKSQVLSLVAELRETERKLQAATQHVGSYKDRSLTLEQKLNMMQDEMDEQRRRDDALIDGLRMELGNMESALNMERQASHMDKRTMAELRSRYEILFQDYDELLKINTELQAKTTELQAKTAQAAPPHQVKEMREQVDNLTAQVISAEDALRDREEKLKRLTQDISQMRKDMEEVPVLKAQADVFRQDFEAEREARQKAHGDMQTLEQQNQELQLENQQLRDEMEVYTRNALGEMQRRHVGAPQMNPPSPPANVPRANLPPMEYAGNYGYPRGYPYPGPHEDFFYDGQMGNNDHLQPVNMAQPRVQNIQQGALGIQRPASPDTEEKSCPKCNNVFPDLDTLQIHVMECLDN